MDPDFAYTKFEKLVKKSHENYYAGYIKFLRNVLYYIAFEDT